MIEQKKYDTIVQLKDETLKGLRAWSEAQLRYKPSAEEWSALEIVDHLARTDAGITVQMQSNSAAPFPLNLVDRAKGAVFNVMFRSPVRVKTPAAAKAILPVCPPNFETAAASWDAAVEQLRMFLGGLEHEPDGGVFRHPVAGPMSLVTGLDFLETHTRHHLHQLERLQKAWSVKAGGMPC